MLKHLLTLALLTTTACSTSHAAPAAAPVAKADATKIDIAKTAMYELAARRAKMIGWLREYREAGQYPTDASGRVASVFVGTNGVRCPMAELLHKSGRDDLVAAVARDNNIVRLADVRQGPLYDWMMSSGLTLAEIDMVQGIAMIDYGWMEEQVIPVETGPMILAGQAQVRGKIETVEVALRNSTAPSLAIVTKQIPANRTVASMTKVPITDGIAVVPEPSKAELEARAKAEREALAQQMRPRRVQFRPAVRIGGLEQIQFRN